MFTVLAAGALAGCASHPEPSNYDDVTMGPNVRVGAIQLRDVHVAAPADPAYSAGADAILWLTLHNDGRTSDALVAVTTPVAKKAEIRWDDKCDGTFTTVDRLNLQPAGPVPQSSPKGVPVFDAYRIRLVDLARKVPAGTTVPVTFRFARAGAITVAAAVQPSVPRAEPSTRCVPESAPSGRGSRAPGPSGSAGAHR